jgi:phosphoglycolate phosphatase-like HAD superfamily hydrolase
VVAVDIDGTLGDYHGHFMDFAASYFDFDTYDDRYDGHWSFRDWFIDQTGLTVKDWHDVKLAYRQGGMKRTMPMYIGADSLCWNIKRAGAELWVTTTRPYLSLDNIVPDTVEWLRRHEIEYDGMLFDDDKYEQLVRRVDPERIVAVIDDLPEMLRAADEALNFRAATYMMSTPYNSALPWTQKHDMLWYSRHMEERIYEWYRHVTAV